MKSIQVEPITIEVSNILVGKYDISFSYCITLPGGKKETKDLQVDHNMDPEFIRDIAKNPTKIILREIIKSLP